MAKKKFTLLCIAIILLVSIPAITMGFPDTQNHWAWDTIEWAKTQNMVTGYPDGTFKPNERVTEAEFLTMLTRAYLGELQQNANSNHWADPYYSIANSYNFPVRGFTHVAIRNSLIDRTKVAEIVAGAQGVNYSGRDAILYLLLSGLAEGRDPNNITINNYDGGAYLTRAEAIQFVRNVLENGGKDMKPRPNNPSPTLPQYGNNETITPNPENIYEKPKTPSTPPSTPIQPATTELTAADKKRLAEYKSGYLPGHDQRTQSYRSSEEVHERDPSSRQFVLERGMETLNELYGKENASFKIFPYIELLYVDDYSYFAMRGILQITYFGNNEDNLTPNVTYERDMEYAFSYRYGLQSRQTTWSLQDTRPLSDWRTVE